MLIFIITIATAISTTLGGLFALRFKDKLHLFLGFSAGAVLGVALFDLLPESIELTKDIYPIQLITLHVAFGFCIYMILDRVFSLHGHKDQDSEPKNGNLGAAALTFHSLLDGFGIGLAFKISPVIGGVVALAVLSHDFSDGINTVSMILKNKGNRSTTLKWLAADALSPAIGVVLANFLNVKSADLGLILSIFVGLFLYISASDLIPESHHKHPAIWTTISTLLGMFVIYCAIFFAGM